MISKIYNKLSIINTKRIYALKPKIDVSKTSQGLITIDCIRNKQLAVLVEKNANKEYYMINEENKSIPLQFGDGIYIIKILEQKKSTSYKIIHKAEINIKLTDVNSVYLQSIQQINFNSEQNVIKKTVELTKKLKTNESKLKSIHSYIISNSVYDHSKTMNQTYLPNIEETFLINKGICYDFASMLAGMLRSQGIPTKLIKGYIKGYDGYHAWNEVFINDEWKTIDITFDISCYASQIEFDIYKSNENYIIENVY